MFIIIIIGGEQVIQSPYPENPSVMALGKSSCLKPLSIVLHPIILAANSQVKLNRDRTISRPQVSGFDNIIKSFQSAFSCYKKQSASQTNHHGSFLQLAFALRRFVVDVDTQFTAIFDLQHNPGLSHGSAKTYIIKREATQQTGLVHDVLGLFAFKRPIPLHVTIPHSQSLYDQRKVTFQYHVLLFRCRCLTSY